MTQANKEGPNKKAYSPPRLMVHGDIETITLGNDLGDAADAAFTTAAAGSPKGKNKTKKDKFS